MCLLGRHSWDGCKCSNCEKVRNEEHDWDGCKCKKCGETRNEEHSWNNKKDCNKCSKCGKTRPDSHKWEYCKCTVCGKIRDWGHKWGEEGCLLCGAKLDDSEIAKRWAQNLKNIHDFDSIATFICTYPCDTDVPSGYDKWELYFAKKKAACKVLKQEGVEVVDSILGAMEKGTFKKDEDLVQILIGIDDPKAVPLLKRLLDSGAWSSDGFNDQVKWFINKYKDYQGETEKVTCSICGMTKLITETKQCEDKRFCDGICWSKRGHVLKHGIGSDCPFFVEGVCLINGKDTGLCSLQIGHYKISCHVYSMHQI
jgi:hypothetical protein